MRKNDSLTWVEPILYTLHALCVLELGVEPIRFVLSNIQFINHTVYVLHVLGSICTYLLSSISGGSGKKT